MGQGKVHLEILSARERAHKALQVPGISDRVLQQPASSTGIWRTIHTWSAVHPQLQGDELPCVSILQDDRYIQLPPKWAQRDARRTVDPKHCSQGVGKALCRGHYFTKLTVPWLRIQFWPFLLQGFAPLAGLTPMMPCARLQVQRACVLLWYYAHHLVELAACSPVWQWLAWPHLRVQSGCDSTCGSGRQHAP